MPASDFSGVHPVTSGKSGVRRPMRVTSSYGWKWWWWMSIIPGGAVAAGLMTTVALNATPKDARKAPRRVFPHEQNGWIAASYTGAQRGPKQYKEGADGDALDH